MIFSIKPKKKKEKKSTSEMYIPVGKTINDNLVNDVRYHSMHEISPSHDIDRGCLHQRAVFNLHKEIVNN